MSDTTITTELEPRPRAGSTLPEFARRIRVSTRSAARIIARGEVKSFLIGGRRLIDDDDADAYIERCKAKGAQFEPPPPTGKRPVGRPRKHPKPEAATASAAE